MPEARTEPATARKLRRAREQGEVWSSPVLTGAAALLAATAAMAGFGPGLIERLRHYLASALRAAPTATPADAGPALERGLDIAASCLAPILLSVFGAALLVELLQVRPLFTLRPLLPRSSRVDPFKGLRRLGEGRGIGAMGFSLLLALVLVVVLVDAGRASLPTLASMVHAGPRALAPALGALVVGLLWRASAALAALGAVDVLRQRALFARDQRMTRREVERERREAEGYPAMAAERWRVFRSLAAGVADTTRRRARARGR